MLPQPLSQLTIVGKVLFDDLPEPRRVIPLPDMSQFMDDHIIDDREGSHHEAPGKGQGILGRTSSPLIFGRSDPFSPGMNLDPVLIMLDALPDDRFSFLSIPLNEKILGPFPEACSQMEQAPSKYERPLILFILSDLQRARLAQIEEPFARGEFPRFPMPLSLANQLEFPVDPTLFFFDEAMNLLPGDSHRHTNNDRSVALDGESQGPPPSLGSNDVVMNGFVHVLPRLIRDP
jgi:hypothetical protein